MTRRHRRRRVLLVALFALPTLLSLVTARTSTELDGTHRIHLLAQGSHGLLVLLPTVAMLRRRWRHAAAVQQLLVIVALAVAIALPARLLPSPAAAVPPPSSSARSWL